MAVNDRVRCRLIHDDGHDGNFNMAADQWLADWAAESGQTALRFYSWSEPTLSLGYFQKLADRNLHQPSQKCPVVRRSSGGGAIVHDRELTYSFATPIRDRLQASAGQVYDLFHQTLLDTLANLKISTRLATKRDVASAVTNAFLCFERRSVGDVILGTRKVCGSAQRRHANCLLQHGSVLVTKTEYAPELPGITDLSQRDLDVVTLKANWIDRISDERGFDVETSGFSRAEVAKIRGIADRRFGASGWLHRR